MIFKTFKSDIGLPSLVIVMVYYGLSFAAGSLPGSVHVNNVISGLVELVAYIITFFTLEKLGRKKLTCGPLLFAGIAMILGIMLNQFIKPKICSLEDQTCVVGKLSEET